MFDLSILDNYLYITNSFSDNLTDRSASLIEIVKKNASSTTYNVRYNGDTIDQLCDVPWTDFTLDGVPFANQQAFEDWKNLNTGINSGESLQGLLTEENVTQPLSNGVNTSVPAGFRTVLITSLSGINVINFGNPSNFQIGNGRRPDGTVLSGEQMNYKNGILPAITITGGTWQWIGLSPL